jgi:hypothetical protein
MRSALYATPFAVFSPLFHYSTIPIPLFPSFHHSIIPIFPLPLIPLFLSLLTHLLYLDNLFKRGKQNALSQKGREISSSFPKRGWGRLKNFAQIEKWGKELFRNWQIRHFVI